MLSSPEFEILTESPAGQKFLGLHLPPSLNVLLSTQQLTEILPIMPLDITPVPESPDRVMGVYNWRGEVLWLLDLGYLLNQAPLFEQGNRQFGYSVIVIQYQSHALGLVVDKIGDIQTIKAGEIVPPKLDATVSSLTSMFQGCYQASDAQHHWILDVDAVIDRIAQSIHNQHPIE